MTCLIATIGLNNEIYNPLLHGEISTINNFFTLNKRNDSKECISFSLPMNPVHCVYQRLLGQVLIIFITFSLTLILKINFQYLMISKLCMKVFNIKQGNYNSSNFYWQSFSIIKEIFNLPLI